MPQDQTTKQTLLALLQQGGGAGVSGQALARQLGVSRAAVHKAAAALARQGYQIQAVPGRGYQLTGCADVLSREALCAALPGWRAPIQVYATVGSTNQTAKQLALAGAPHGSLVVAGGQTEGRGRLGRSFVSPPGKGVYLSMVLRPGGQAADSLAVTGAAAVAVCRAVERLCGLRLGIKWVNDLFWQGKKVCGILTEASADLESGQVDYLAVGIGLNLTSTSADLGPDLAITAGSLYPGGPAPCTRAQLAAAIAAELVALGPGRGYLPEYRARSLVLGHWLTVHGPQGSFAAKALRIDNEGRLVVQLPGGGVQALRAGEVSVRPAPLLAK